MSRVVPGGDHARRIVEAILNAADPSAAVERHLPPELEDLDGITLIATGKASAPMTEAALRRIGGNVRSGCVTCVPAHEQRVRAACEAARVNDRVAVKPCDHPLATERNLEAAKAVAGVAEAAGAYDHIVALVSGGASAHLIMPADGITLDDLRAATSGLLRAGATINELNAVRKHCERLKGGRLAALASPARVTALVLSDVPGDPLDTIGSGPLAPDPTTYARALEAVQRRQPAGFPKPIVRHLERGAAGDLSETPKPGDPDLDRVQHRIIANNAAGAEAAAACCRSLGYRVAMTRTGVSGEAARVAAEFVEALRAAAAATEEPVALVWGGETTVDVGDATGLGGRNTELALAAAIEIDGSEHHAIIAIATDGIDGPTDAAGAVVTGETAHSIGEKGGDARGALADHNSYHVLSEAGGLIITGPTGSNINDVIVGMSASF